MKKCNTLHMYGKRGLWRRLKAANQQPLTPVNFNSRNELLDFLLDVDSGTFNFDSACFVQLLAYLLSGAKGSFSNTDRTGKTVGGVASDSEGMPQFQILICYLGFPDLKVGNELPTYRRGIWLFRRGLDSFCSLNNGGVESFAFPAWKGELSRSLFVAGDVTCHAHTRTRAHTQTPTHAPSSTHFFFFFLHQVASWRLTSTSCCSSAASCPPGCATAATLQSTSATRSGHTPNSQLKTSLSNPDPLNQVRSEGFRGAEERSRVAGVPLDSRHPLPTSSLAYN